MKTSDLFIKALENEGVEYIFGIPGEENLDFLDSLKNSNIRLILTRHEQGAGFMAATYGRLTGKPGVCLATLGPGATNFVTPAAYAQLGAMPMLMITGQKPIKESKQGRFQIIDVVGTLTPITKFSKQIVDGNNIPSVVREAFRLSMEERPGAVHIELPEDIASEDTTERLFKPLRPHLPIPNELALDEAASLITEAKHPLILVGAGANRKELTESLSKLIETTKIPFFNTQMGKGVVDERSPQYLGTAALSADDFLHCAISRSDLIINIGHDVIEKPPFFMEIGGTKVIHINYFSAQVDDVYFPDLDVVGDINSSIQGLEARLADEVSQKNWDFAYYSRIKEEVKENLGKYANDDRFPMLPQCVVSIMREALGDDDIVTLDNGVYKIWFARNYPCYAPNTLLLDNALATMGAGLPSAMAAKMLNPNQKVVAVCGTSQSSF